MHRHRFVPADGRDIQHTRGRRGESNGDFFYYKNAQSPPPPPNFSRTTILTLPPTKSIPSSERHAVQGDLADPADPSPASLSGPEFYDFALAAVGGGFHHFANPELAATRIVERLSPGGVLAIWDFFTHDKDSGVHSHDRDHRHGHHHHGHDHSHSHSQEHNHSQRFGQENPARDTLHEAAHTITRHGFSEAELKDMFTAAGAGEGFAVLDMGDYTFNRDDDKPFTRRVFLARGQKPRGGSSAAATEEASL